MLTEKQQKIYEWLNDKLQLPVYAEAYKGAVLFLKEESPGYVTFVSHAGRDIMNTLARTAIGITSSQVQYRNLVDELQRKWQPEWRGPGLSPPQSSSQHQNGGHLIPYDVCEMICDLIKEHEDGESRSKGAGNLFFDTFLGSSDKDKITNKAKWGKAREFFMKKTHLCEKRFTEEVPAELKGHFEALEEFLYIAATTEYARIRNLDAIQEQANSSCKNPTNQMIERALALIEKETDRQYFFSRLKNPRWIQPLSERGCFKSPPAIRYLSDGYLQYSSWPELEYLKNVSQNAPEEILQIVSELPAVDNPRVYSRILDIALSLKGEQSARLKPKMLEYAKLPHQLFANEYQALLAHWTAEDQTQAALELAAILVQFRLDPQGQENRRPRAEGSLADPIATWLDPKPKFDGWDYGEILNKGVRPLADKKPFQVAHMLMNATATMICLLGKHQNEIDNGTSRDHLEVTCPKLNESSWRHPDVQEILIHTLTHACERVYEQSPEKIETLDSALRNQRWDIFKRLRQHLYALYPNELTKPWIRELILTHGDYAKWQHHYEFQQMIQRSCEHFGTELLAEDKCAQIFDAILSGPSRESYRERLSDELTETEFARRQRYFHRVQLRPFAAVLFGKYTDYFEELENDSEADEITDETYLPFRVTSSGGYVTPSSPKSPDELSRLSDEELLNYINEWQDERYHNEDDQCIEIKIPALADTFQSVFTKFVIPDEGRLRFWVEQNREQIDRPIYIKAMVQAMHEQIKDGRFEQLSQWFDFCKWVLSRSGEDQGEQEHHSDTSRENQSWYTSRLAVCNFVKVCFKVNVPISHREQLSEILKTLCTQFDWVLDRERSALRDDPLTRAINSTRGRALENLGMFGTWVRRYDEKADVPEVTFILEVTSILEERLKPEAEYPLTIPEYAILGMCYPQIIGLDQEWAVVHKLNFFPRDNEPAWQAAFGNLLHYSHPYERTFKVVRDEFEFALEHLDDLKQQEQFGRKTITVLGKHLFICYLWSVYPLTGTDSLLECFYRKSDGERKRWATLFDSVGRLLGNTDKQQFSSSLRERTIAFFEWRLQVGEPLELCRFTSWLEAECLEAEWRLDSYSKVLDVPDIWDIGQSAPRGIGSSVRSLHTMLSEYTEQVVKCFAKLIRFMPENNSIYISTTEAREILKVGRDHNDESVRNTAAQAREGLLKRGYLSFIDLSDPESDAE